MEVAFEVSPWQVVHLEVRATLRDDRHLTFSSLARHLSCSRYALMEQPLWRKTLCCFVRFYVALFGGDAVAV